LKKFPSNNRPNQLKGVSAVPKGPYFLCWIRN
jgi:hypothetical protein